LIAQPRSRRAIYAIPVKVLTDGRVIIVDYPARRDFDEENDIAIIGAAILHLAHFAALKRPSKACIMLRRPRNTP